MKMSKNEKILNVVLGVVFFIAVIGVPAYLYIFFLTSATAYDSKTTAEEIEQTQEEYGADAFGEKQGSDHDQPRGRMTLGAEGQKIILEKYFYADGERRTNIIPKEIDAPDFMGMLISCAQDPYIPSLRSNENKRPGIQLFYKDIIMFMKGYSASIRVFFDNRNEIKDIEFLGSKKFSRTDTSFDDGDF